MLSQRPSFIQLPVLPDVDALIEISTPSPEPMFFTAPSSPLGDVSTVPVTPPEDTPNEAFPSLAELPTELDLDDHGLTTLEKIYLFSRSQATFHRLFIARELPTLLQSVSPHDAVEYVLPLLTALALDEDEQVKETFVAELVLIIWWFVSNCQLTPVNVDPSPHGPATISVDAFTPILGTLLLSRNPHVNVPARYAVVDLFQRMRRADQLEDRQQIDHDPALDLPSGLLGKAERALLESEILSQVVVGMGRLDLDQGDEQDEDVFLTPAVDLVAFLEFSDGSPGSVSTPSTTETVKEDNVNPYFPLLASSSGTSPARSSTSLSSSSSSDSRRSTPSSTTGTTASESSSASSPEHFDDFYHPGANNRDDKAVSQLPTLPSQNTFMPPPMSPPVSNSSGLSSANLMDEFSARNSFHVQTLLERATLNLVLPNNNLRIRDTPPDNSLLPPENDILHKKTVYGSEQVDSSGETITNSDRGFTRPPQVSTESDPITEEEDSDREQAAVGRLSSMSLMAAVAVSGCLSESTKHTFVQEVERVAQDPVYWVRREACFALGALAKVVPEEVVLISLLPLLQTLLQDLSPDVRSSSLFALPAILSRLPFQRRRKLALNTILPMSTDNSPDVRHRVLEALGEVIYTFHDEQNGVERAADGEEEDEGGGPPEELVQMFLNPPAVHSSRSPNQEGDGEKALKSFYADPSRPLICAFNFPAVALAVGRARWKSDLRATYLSLATDSTCAVRQTLAASLGEMAKIIGADNAGEDLLPVWLGALKSDEAEVRLKALACMEVLCEALTHISRRRAVRELSYAYEQGALKSWRERELVAKSLKGLVLLAEGSKEMFASVRTLLRHSLWDPINAVREAGVISLPVIWTTLHGDDEQLAELQTDVDLLAQSQNFRRRMIFIACQQSLVLPGPDGKSVIKPDDKFWASLASLENDPITDVRIGLARLVGIACSQLNKEGKVTSGILLDLSRQLSQDPSKEVQSYVPDPCSQAETLIQPLDLHDLDFRTKPVATFSRPAVLQRHSTSLDTKDL